MARRILTYYTNNATVSTTVKAFPDLLVTKTASPNILKLGEIITYTINCSNIGCGIGTGVMIEDDYDELHTQIVDAGGGVVSNGKITWNAGNITPQSGYTLNNIYSQGNQRCMWFRSDSK